MRNASKLHFADQHIGYVRVSTEEQSMKGVGLADQEARIRAHAFARGVELSEVIVDPGYSAKDLKRPGAQRLLEMIRRGQVASVTILKLDRLTRNTRDLGELLELVKKNSVALISVGESLDTETAAGRMVVSMLGVVAQWERETIAERTASAMAYKRRQGAFCGSKRAPYGYRNDAGRVVTDDAEQAVLADVHGMRDAQVSLRRIVATLNDRAIASPGGGRWSLTGLVSVLNSKTAKEARAAA